MNLKNQWKIKNLIYYKYIKMIIFIQYKIHAKVFCIFMIRVFGLSNMPRFGFIGPWGNNYAFTWSTILHWATSSLPLMDGNRWCFKIIKVNLSTTYLWKVTINEKDMMIN
jgi:hypothetical protein